MIRRSLGKLRDWSGPLALFLVLTSGAAYAANEWTGANIQDETLTGADIDNGSLRSADLRNGQVQMDDLELGAVGAAQLQSNAIPADGSGTVGSSKLAPQSVGYSELMYDSVTSTEVRDGSLTGADIGFNQLGSDEVADGMITGSDLADGTVANRDIASSVPVPKALGIFRGPCVGDNNCPLEFNRGITSWRVGDHSAGDYTFCVKAGNLRGPMVATVSQSYGGSIYYEPFPNSRGNAFHQCADDEFGIQAYFFVGNTTNYRFLPDSDAEITVQFFG